MKKGFRRLNFCVNERILTLLSQDHLHCEKQKISKTKIYSTAMASHHIVASPKCSVVVSIVCPTDIDCCG